MIMGLLGKSHQDLTSAWDSVSCSLGHAFAGGTSVRSLQATWPNRVDAEAAAAWRNLAKFSTDLESTINPLDLTLL